MQTTLRIALNDTQLDELRQLARHASGRVCQRAHFVIFSHKGYSPQHISALMDYSVNAIKKWLRAYMALGAAGLDDQPRSGRPVREPHLTDVLEAQASQAPTCFGYLQTTWTLALLVMHLSERFKILCSASTLRRAFSEIRYSWHRPKLYPAKRPDPLAEERKQVLDAALTDESAVVVAVDECDMSLLAVLRGMWQPINTQARLPTPGQNAKIGIFGAINLRTGELDTLCSARKRSQDFIRFLHQLLERYPIGTVHIILDNATIHSSKLTQKWLAMYPRLHMVYLPTYSGHLLNPIEKVWWQLKQHIAANRNFRTIEKLTEAVNRWFLATRPEANLQLINCAVTRRAALPPRQVTGVRNLWEPT